MLSSLVIHLLCYWAVRSQWCLCLSLGLFWEAHRFCQVLAGGITAGDLQQVFPGPFKSTWSFDPGPAPALLCVSFCLLPRGGENEVRWLWSLRSTTVCFLQTALGQSGHFPSIPTWDMPFLSWFPDIDRQRQGPELAFGDAIRILQFLKIQPLP